MTCEVEVIKAAVSGGTEHRLASLRLRYWRAIHAELMTHRVFSRNAGSSRAIPVKRMLKQIWNDPAGPIHWGANQSGMQANEQLTGWRLWAAKKVWRLAARFAAFFSWLEMKIGLHKQVANRITEPYQYINVMVTSTDWDNFFHLRCHPDAQPEFQELALKMQDALEEAPYEVMHEGDWYLPWILPEEEDLPLDVKLKLSTARSARISYEPFDGNASIEKECERHDKLVASEPIHASPTEHAAECTGDSTRWANFTGFRQYRWLIEHGLEVPHGDA